jgi:hypothetical protein
MSIMDFIKGELIEVIEWTDDSRDTLSFRFPDDDKAIKNGAQLIVRESQAVQFVYLGEFGDTFGPGKHTLTTDNIPVLTRLKSWKYGFNSPFKADVYFLTTRLFTGNKWGTANPIMLRDHDFGVVRVRAFGTYDFHIVNPKLFLKEVAELLRADLQAHPRTGVAGELHLPGDALPGHGERLHRADRRPLPEERLEDPPGRAARARRPWAHRARRSVSPAPGLIARTRYHSLLSRPEADRPADGGHDGGDLGTDQSRIMARSRARWLTRPRAGAGC